MMRLSKLIQQTHRKSLSMNRILMCDLDGTLIDSRMDLTTGINLMRAEYNLSELTMDTVTGYVGDGIRKLVERALKEINVDIDEAIGLMKRFYMENMFRHTRLYPGIKEGVKELYEAGWKLALISNKPTGPCSSLLKHFEIDTYFYPVIGGDTDLPIKPDPAALLSVLAVTDCIAGKSWMMGDSHNDLGAAKRAGVKSCYAAYGFGNPKDEPYDFKASTFSELVQHLI